MNPDTVRALLSLIVVAASLGLIAAAWLLPGRDPQPLVPALLAVVGMVLAWWFRKEGPDSGRLT